MEAGVIAGVVIVSVALVIIIILVIYLLSNKKRPASEKETSPETGNYKDENPEKSEEPLKTSVSVEKEELKTEKEVSLSSESESESESSSDSKSVSDESEPDDTKPILKSEIVPENVVLESNDIDKSSENIPEPPVNQEITKDDVALMKALASAKEVSSSPSSSDEGVGDVEKPPLTSESSSSSDSSESEPEEKDHDEKNVPSEKEDKKSSSESSSSSEDEKETENNEPISDVQNQEVVSENPMKIEVYDSRNSTPKHSLENGITLSLRLDNTGEKVSSSSSSTSSSYSSSSDEEGIKVIRTKDKIQDKNGGISMIYDPLSHKVVNMDDYRERMSTSSSSSDSDDEEPVPNQGDEVVAGIINVTSGEKLTISKAVSNGLIPEKTGMLLLEAQAATGSVVNPRTGVKLSVTDAIKQGIVDSRYKATLSASEGAFYGFLDPRKNESVPLFEAMRRGIFPRAQGMRLLEAQVATGGVIDPWTTMRYPLPRALAKGLIDRETAKVLKNPDDHADFFDPNTKQRFSYGNLLSKCIRDLNTGMKFLYLEEKPTANFAQYQPDLLTFRSAFRRKVSLQDLISAGLVKQKTLEAFNRGDISRSDLYERLKPYLIGEPPIAGIYNRTNHQVLTICQAVKAGLLRRSTALELLEAQAATGNIIDPKSGKQLSVNRAVSVGLVDSHFASALRKAELAVLGYQYNEKNVTISLYEAMKKGLVIESQGVRLLDAQIATGGLIDAVGGYRIPISVAVRKGMIDQRLADALANPTPDQKGYYDPNTGENLTYAELLHRAVTDKKKHIGMRLLPLHDKAPNVRMVSKNMTRSRKIVIMNPKTKKPMSLKQAVSAKVIDIETARRLEAQQGTRSLNN